MAPRTGLQRHNVLAELGGPRIAKSKTAFLIEEADTLSFEHYAQLRRDYFVATQGLFVETDFDDADQDERTIVLIARKIEADGELGDVVGGVRIHPIGNSLDGWWMGSRLITSKGASAGVGAALVRAACSRAEAEGALRFDAQVQADRERFFTRIGWQKSKSMITHGIPHVLMHWPIEKFARTAEHKSAIGRLVSDIQPGGNGWIGDDGAPVPGSDLVVVNDAILPSMVERDPWWAGWCSVLVNMNDLCAMGAQPSGLLNSIGAPTESLARRVIGGMTSAADAWGIDVLGGHTQLGVHGSLSVTMVGRTDCPVPGGGAKPRQRLSLIADIAGQWRPGYSGRQWDSTSTRSPKELRSMHQLVAELKPSSCKDVSMAGVVGTAAMLAEASGAAAAIDIESVPRPEGVPISEWLTCFPGYAMLITHDDPIVAGETGTCLDTIDGLVVGEIGTISVGSGVTLRWPDGYEHLAVGATVTGLGTSGYKDVVVNA